MQKKLVLWLVVFLQICFLGGMIFYHHAKLKDAERILLKTVPYDPVSIFRGHYASLRYEISSLPVSLLKDITLQELKNVKELFVLLEKDVNYWQAKGVYKKHPKDGKVYLRARLPNYYFDYDFGQVKTLNLEYGIESFFLNEERAGEVDRFNRWQGRNWQAIEQERKKRINQLDEETQRIHKANITQWWFVTLDKELEIWVKEGIINLQQKDKIYQKYAQALEKIKAIENTLSSVGIPPEQKPIIVEVAIDRSGFGHLLRLWVDGREYK